MLPSLPEWAAGRRAAAAAYDAAGLGESSRCPRRRPAASPPGTSTSSVTRAPARSPPRSPREGIEARRYYRAPMHRQPAHARLGARARAPGHRRGGRRAPRPAHEPRLSGAEQAAEVAAARSRDALAALSVRVWVDLTNSPHVLVLAPLIAALAGRRPRGRGHRARLRPDARAVRALRDRAHRDRPPPRRRGSAPRPVGLADRSARAGALGARPRASTSPSATAPTTSPSPRGCCASPPRRCSTTSGPRCSTRSTAGWPGASSCPTPSRRSGSRRYGARGKLAPYPGLKEEYYLADFEPDPAVLDELGLDPTRPLAVVRTPPAVSLYHRFENPLFADVLAAAARARPDRRAAPDAGAAGRAAPRSAASSSPSRPSTPSRSSPRRPRHLRGRDDEPRGRGARHPGVDRVRGPARRGRRARSSPRAG